jgi:hypothetical protein
MPAANVSRRTAGEGSGRTARVHVCEESDSGILPMNHSNKGADPREHFSICTFPTQSGCVVSYGWARVRTSSTLGRYSSAIRAAYANERSCGSVRGVPREWYPYRDRQSCCIAGTISLQVVV